MANREGLRRLEAESKSFREYCQESGLTDEDVRDICRPLLADSEGAARRAKAWMRAFPALTLLLLLPYWASGSERVRWHASAVGRILMIEALPFWDWTPLFYERCLIDGSEVFDGPSSALAESDCAVCEAVADVRRISEANYDSILDRHLSRGAPVIVTDAEPAGLPDANLTRVLSRDERLRDSVPCSIRTNLRTGRQPTDLADLLTKISETDVPDWFVHFQNCDLRAVKSLRTLAPRPYFLSPHVPPAHFNWLLMSDKYSSPRFKPLELDAGLIILSQLRGGTLVRLSPRDPCQDLCPVLTFDVRQSETLVLANSMWSFEYVPDENSQNVAILTETAWNEA